MSAAILLMELRLRARTVLLAALGLVAITAAVGALFPSFGHSIGNVQLPKGVSELLGGGEYATLTGWMKTEVVSVYGPLVVAGVAITSAAATTAGEEENHILALVLAHPISRSRLVLAKAAALGLLLVGLAIAIFAGLLLGVAFAGGGISAANLLAVAVHLLFFGFAVGAFALALGAGTGRRSIASGIAASVTVVMFLVNGFAPVVSPISWLKYTSLFHYYEGQDQIVTGVHPVALAVLALVAGLLVAIAVLAFAKRDLRG